MEGEATEAFHHVTGGFYGLDFEPWNRSVYVLVPKFVCLLATAAPYR